MSNNKITTIDNKYELSSDKKNLDITVVNAEIDRMKKVPASLDENFLNTWIDEENGQSSTKLVTRLDSFETTLADFKEENFYNDIRSFKDTMIPLISALLKFVYFMESGKEWYVPLNPLNLVYNESTETVKAFYRHPTAMETVDQGYLSDLSRLIAYLLYPETNTDVSDFEDNDAQYYFSAMDNDEFIKKYDNAEELIEYAFQNFLTDELNLDSVKVMLRNIGREDIIDEVDTTDGVVTGDVVNLTNYDEDTVPPVVEQPEKKNGKKTKEEMLADARQRKLDKKNKKKDGNKKKSNKLVIFIVIIILTIIAFFGYSKLSNNNSSNNGQTSSSKPSTSPETNSDFKNGVTNVASSDFHKASSNFDKYFSNDGGSLNDLNSKQIAIVFSAYLNDGQYQKILTNIGNDKTATALVNYLYSQNKNSEIKSLNSQLSIVQFAKANENNDYSKMISLVNSVDTTKNASFQKNLTVAFAKENKLAEGKTWADSQPNKDTLINAIKAEAYNQPNANKDEINKTLGVN